MMAVVSDVLEGQQRKQVQSVSYDTWNIEAHYYLI
jgi:hypothetical protein